VTWQSGLISIQTMSIILVPTFTKNPLGQFKVHENVDFASSFSATAVKIVADGKTLLDVDCFSNTYQVNGKDPLRRYLAATGPQ